MRNSTSSTVAWLKFNLITVIPAWTNSCNTGNCSDVGPIVATIFVSEPWQLFGLALRPSGSIKLVETLAGTKEVVEIVRGLREVAHEERRRAAAPDRREAIERVPQIISQ